MARIQLLTSVDSAAFQAMRLEAVAHDPYAFLSTPEVEQAKTIQHYANEIVAARLLPPFGYYGVFDEDRLLGYVQLGTTGLPKKKHIAYIYNLYIDPAARGQRLAEHLCTIVAQIAKAADIERLYANCLRNNQIALKFYHKLGFQICGERVQSVKDADQYDDEIELVKVL
jgi:ribosomal protein S18 acetylase RimI-like enzyme